MVQAAPDLQAVEPEVVDISPHRGGGHAGHVLAFFAAAQLAPLVSMIVALSMVGGGMGDTGWMWMAVGAVALPAFALFGVALFLAEHGFE